MIDLPWASLRFHPDNAIQKNCAIPQQGLTIMENGCSHEELGSDNHISNPVHFTNKSCLICGSVCTVVVVEKVNKDQAVCCERLDVPNPLDNSGNLIQRKLMWHVFHDMNCFNLFQGNAQKGCKLSARLNGHVVRDVHHDCLRSKLKDLNDCVPREGSALL